MPYQIPVDGTTSRWTSKQWFLPICYPEKELLKPCKNICFNFLFQTWRIEIYMCINVCCLSILMLVFSKSMNLIAYSQRVDDGLVSTRTRNFQFTQSRGLKKSNTQHIGSVQSSLRNNTPPIAANSSPCWSYFKPREKDNLVTYWIITSYLLKTPSIRPFRSVIYLAGPKTQDFEKEVFENILKLKVIEQSLSEWASPIVFAPEKNCFSDYMSATAN